MDLPDPVMNHCGTCTLCCKVMGVKGDVRGVPLKKPRAGWCEHCEIGVGCKVYDDRPVACRTFRCSWLEGREDGHDVPDELRPDRCGVVFAPTTSETACSAHMDRNKPDAWKRGAAAAWIQRIVAAGISVTLDYGDLAEVKTVLRPAGDISASPMLQRGRQGKIVAQRVRFTPPDKDGMQFSIPE